MRVFEIKSACGKYKDRNGEEKTDFIKIGSFFVNDKGQYSGRIKTTPLGWDGSFILQEVVKRDNQSVPTNNSQQQTSAPQPQSPYQADLPF